MKEIIIIGQGPSGISAALYCIRAGFSVKIIAMNNGALEKAHLIENYYGFPQGISGLELVHNGINQAKSLGVKFINDEVMSLGFDGKLIAITGNNSYHCDAMIIATGSSKTKPNIKGLKELEGKGISYCAICDGFFYKNKEVAVLGNGEYALHEAKELLPLASKVTLLSNGKEVHINLPENLYLDTREIVEISSGSNGDIVEKIVFKDGSETYISGLFIAEGSAGSADLAKKLGAATDGKNIIVSKDMSTNLPGLFACGDCTGGLLQISKAVYEGSLAAMSVIKYLRQS